MCNLSQAVKAVIYYNENREYCQGRYPAGAGHLTFLEVFILLCRHDHTLQRIRNLFQRHTTKPRRSLRKFKELFPEEVKLRIRFSLDNLKLDGDVLNIPLFMADQKERLIGVAPADKAVGK